MFTMSLKRFVLIFFIFSFIISHPLSTFSSVTSLKQRIKEYREKLQQEKKKLSKLSKKERELIIQITDIDNKIIEIEKNIEQEEEFLKKIQNKEKKLIEEYKKIQNKKNKAKKSLEKILNNFWPIYLKQKDTNIFDYKNEEEYKLKSEWLKNILNKISSKYKEFSNYSQELTLKLLELQKIIDQKQTQIQLINQKKDTLLASKLQFLKKIEEMRIFKIQQEEHIQEILALVDSLNYKLLLLTNKDISKAKGQLPWPAKGFLKVKFNLKKNPPQRGIGISLRAAEPVRAVFWGKVVHNDVLRGFGRVIILSHGKGYYSLYAFLAKSLVRLGQEVEQGEIIGTSGFYPQLKNYGLYFELRFKQKPINPIKWLKANF